MLNSFVTKRIQLALDLNSEKKSTYIKKLLDVRKFGDFFMLWQNLMSQSFFDLVNLKWIIGFDENN